MKIFKNFNIPENFKFSVLAIGNFDGVHKGHQKVFLEAINCARKNKIKFGVMTFNPIPSMFFNKNLKNFRLSSQKQKNILLKKFGTDFVLDVKFDKKFSKINAQNFIKTILYKKIKPKYIFVSNNFKFGNKRFGNVNLLKKNSRQYNYKVVTTKPFKHNIKTVSSTLIRKSLQEGNIELANKLLSRNWFVDGIVQKGKKLGKKLGYATCNIKIKNYTLPKIGVYAVKTQIEKNKKIFGGIANFGYRPTFGGKKLLLEVNIFRLKKNLYNNNLKIFFVKYIRGEKKFKDSTSLIRQINKDVVFAKKHLKMKLIL